VIGVLGATGTVGRHVALGLARAGAQARVLVRDPERFTAALPAVSADLRDPPSLRRGLDGLQRLLLLTPHGPDQLAQETAAIDAAVAAGVERIVKISGTAASIGPEGPCATAVAHWHSEQRIEASGLRFTFLRPSPYMQGVLRSIAPPVRVAGVLAAPMGRAPVAMVDARDVAAAAVAALAGHLPDGPVALTGPRAVSYADIAGELGVPYLPIPRPVARLALSKQGLDGWEVKHALDMAAFLATGADAATSDGVIRLTGRRPTDIGDFLREHADAFDRRRRPAARPGPWSLA
jgi:NAD(P)H dehydrogenase (quinone)